MSRFVSYRQRLMNRESPSQWRTHESSSDDFSRYFPWFSLEGELDQEYTQSRESTNAIPLTDGTSIRYRSRFVFVPPLLSKSIVSFFDPSRSPRSFRRSAYGVWQLQTSYP